MEELRQLEVGSSNNITCGIEFHRSRSRDTLGREYALTGRQIAKYVSLDRLADSLKMKLDAGELTINSGVALSYLDGPSQSSVAAALEQYGKKLTDAQAAELRALAGSGTLTVPAILDILTRSKGSGLKSIHIKPAGFASVVKPAITIKTNANLASGYQVVNRAGAGGQYKSQWETSIASWVTLIVRLNQPSLPKTGD